MSGSQERGCHRLHSGRSTGRHRRCSRELLTAGLAPRVSPIGTAWAPVIGTDPGLKDNTWLIFSQYPYFVTSQPGIKALDAAMDKYYPGVRTNPNAPSGELVSAWASGMLLKECPTGWTTPARNHADHSALAEGALLAQGGHLGRAHAAADFQEWCNRKREVLVPRSLVSWHSTAAQ